jgi:hypothetical protein
MAPSLGSNVSLQADDISGMNAIVDATISRQSSGFISSLAYQEKETAACGSIEDISKSSNGPGNFLGSLLVGFMLIIVVNGFEKNKKRKILARIS